MMGKVTDAWTSATMSADPEIDTIIQDAPTDWMSPPKLDAKLASQTARKIGTRSGESEDTGATAGAGRRSAMPAEWMAAG